MSAKGLVVNFGGDRAKRQAGAEPGSINSGGYSSHFRRSASAEHHRELYLTLLCMVAQELRPRNIIEWLSLKDVVDLSWEIRRLRRFKALSIEKGRRSRLEPPFRPKPLSEGDLLFSSILGPPPTPPSEADIRRENRQRARRNARLQTEIGSTIVFEETITMYERIDRLLVSAELRRSALLHDMKFYREDLAHLLKDSSTKIIDGEFTETDVPSE